MRIYFLILVSLLFSIASMSQSRQQEKARKRQEQQARLNEMIKQEEAGALVYHKQTGFGIFLNTEGYGGFFERGKYKTVRKSNLWWISAGEYLHPKERKLVNPFSTGGGSFLGSPFVYGKINNLYFLNAGIGQQRLIGGKGIRNGVAVSAIYGGGLSVALLKPYYINVITNAGKEESLRYSTDNARFLDPSATTGPAGFGKGFNEMDYIPGANGKLAVRFDYGRYRELLSALETGVKAEYFTRDVKQMALVDGRKLFLTAYVAIVFGSRK